LTKRPRPRRIKANRKPKIARNHTWKLRILRGEIGEDELEELDLPEIERILPSGREEERAKLRTKVDQEITSEPSLGQQPEPEEEWQPGTVTRISTSIYHVDLGKQTLLCGVRGSLSASQTGYTNVVAVGDEVLVSPGDAGHGIIERVLPRRTVLGRPDVFIEDLSQILVANVDQLLIVAAWEEPPVWLELIDRYLIAAAEGKLESLICLNKIDLAASEQYYRDEMSVYENLGYTVVYTSVVMGQGIDELTDHLIGQSTVLAGQSGAGKSSLLNAVQPGLELRVAEVSQYSGAGRHTTTQVSLLKLDRGGYVVDTPGIRELGLITTHRHELVLHFPEIAKLVGQCQFTDCTHTHEPGCAVIEAVEEGRIPWSRYASYQTIYESLPEYYTE
jgi:ribosome biogenesis GTPase